MMESRIKQAWENGKIVRDHDASKARKDACGAWIVFSEYGNRESGFGWQIDRGGGNKLSKLRPLQWENKTGKGAGRLVCVVTSKGGANVRA